jgi:BASS family bile acid:Na+ symporter
MIHSAVRLFPLWAALACLLAAVSPSWFSGLQAAVVPLLGLVMSGMGMTLSPQSFAPVLQRPWVVGLGCMLQYLIMPLGAWVVAKMFAMPPDLTAGMVLVGTCPGGTASNVICYLARGDVALSVALTASSTLLAVALTRLLTWCYVGQTVPVPILDLLSDVARVVVLPVALGVWLNTRWHVRPRPLQRWFPVLSVAAIVLIIAIIVAVNRARLAALGATVLAGVVVHNAVGLAAGYAIPWLLGIEERARRTLAIEVGMQNSGLAVALAGTDFSAAAALPGAVFSVWHNHAGSALATYWARRSESLGR